MILLKVFISWSGDLGKATGNNLKNFLGLVIQSLEIFISTEMERGSIWNNLINRELRDTSCGIICLTEDNYESPWILFESGALAKGIDQNRICTFLVNIDPSDLLNSPLAQFNHTFPSKESCLLLVKTINHYIENPLEEKKLETVFEKFWPDFWDSFEKEIEAFASKRTKRSPVVYKELATVTLDAINRINLQLSEDAMIKDTVRRIEYRIEKLFDLEFGKKTTPASLVFIHREPQSEESTMVLWLHYSDDFEDNIAVAANEILNQFTPSLKDDFAKYECNWIDEPSYSKELSIKFTFIRENVITETEYSRAALSSVSIFKKHSIKQGGIRCTGKHIE